MEAKLVGLGVETFKMALMLALPGLLTGMFLGLAVSIFQATTQINEMTLSFIPKIRFISLSGTLLRLPTVLTHLIFPSLSHLCNVFI